MISSIPAAFGEMKQLIVLSLTNNKLDSLTPEVCQLVNLRRLYVRGNALSSLPNLMGQMHSLVHLDCGNNKFTVFPEVLTSMPRIVHLDFSGNAIATLPSTLEDLKCLVYLNLIGNKVVKPPNVLLRMPWLGVLGCPLSAELRGSTPYIITLSEEHELLNLLKGRAAASITNKLRRRKKKTSYTL